MTSHDVHCSLHNAGPATVGQLAERFRCAHRSISNRLLHLLSMGRVTRSGAGRKGAPYIYASAQPPQSTVPGLTARVADCICPHHRARFLRVSGFGASSLDAALAYAAFDTPDTARQFTRDIAAGTLDRLATKLEAEAAAMRDAAVALRKAQRGEL